MVFDITGRLASRQGWISQTAVRLSFPITFTGAPVAGATGATLSVGWAQASGTGQVVFSTGEFVQATVTSGLTSITWVATPIATNPTVTATFYPAIQAMAELAQASGAVFTVSAGNNKLYSGTATFVDITGSLTITGNNWQFVTFNGFIYGIQTGHPLIRWNGTGVFVLAPLASPKSFTGSIATGTPLGVLTVSAISSGVLGSGDLFTGTGVATGTQIVAQLSGVTGGIGTYSVNNSQTTASTPTMAVAAGVVPTGGSSGVASFGRLWVMSPDNQTLNYCSLLDGTTWNGVGAGSINMATVWTKGIDQVIGVAAAGNKLIVFGTKQILLFFDATNPPIGLNPTNISVYDTIEGTGLVARDTIQSTGEGDLLFLSPTGVQSLQRLLSSGKGNPIAALDGHVHDYFNTYFVNENAYQVRSAYSPLNRFYIILLPSSRRAFVYDTRFKLQGTGATLGELPGALRVTEWPNLTWSSLISTKANLLYYGENGQVGQYAGYTDNLSAYQLVYQSPYLALNSQASDTNFENRLKILKRMKCVFFYGGTTVVNAQWGVDFKGLTQTFQLTLNGALSEYGIAQFAINEFGGGAGIQVNSFPISLSGRWLQFGLNATINGYLLAIQQMDAFVKIGNMV